jgi:hypothetical protein
VIAVAALAGWMLLTAYAGSIFIACAAVASWRLWHVAAGAPMRVAGSPRTGQPDRRATVAPRSVRPPRSLDQAVAELDGMIGLAGTKDEIGKLVVELHAERERARFGHRTDVPSLHCVGHVALGHGGVSPWAGRSRPSARFASAASSGRRA